MADGGILLNFAAGDSSVTRTTPKFRGGHWRERSRLNNHARDKKGFRTPDGQFQGRFDAVQRARRDKTKAEAQGSKDVQEDENGFNQPPPPKRRKYEGQAKQDDRPIHLRGTKFGGNEHVVSSLFSFNPEAQTVETQTESAISTEPVKPSNAPLPDGIETFTSLGLSESVAAHLLTRLNLQTPTEVQRAAVTQLLKEDADVFVQSETGSGKTLAYLLPIVQRLVTIAQRMKHESETVKGLDRSSGLFAIMLAPTRELCKQIELVLERLLGCAHFIVPGIVIGGESKKSEKARLRKGINILVATPGRLVDHFENTQTLDLSKVRYLVLDEGDRLMDLGFEEDITKIVQTLDQKSKSSDIPGLPARRITVLCSATLRSNVEKLGDISLKDAVLVKGQKADAEKTGTTDRPEDSFLAPAQLKQSYIICATKLRLVTLIALLKRTFARKGSVMKAVIFMSCADSVDFHHKILTRVISSSDHTPRKDDSTSDPHTDIETSTSAPGEDDMINLAPTISTPANPVTAYRLHGSLPQSDRTRITASFAKSASASLLIATDVASRGLDIPNLDLVIEYDPAFSKEDHLHRIGRTARLGRDGRAVIFLAPGSEEGYIEVLENSYKTVDAIGAKNGNLSKMRVDDVLQKGFSDASGTIANKKDMELAATEFQLDVERSVLGELRLREMAGKAFMSHVRAYATHTSAERKWFDIKGLHLGHLAKAFGLRDPPAKINVQGLRGAKSIAKGVTDRRKTIENTKAGSEDASVADLAKQRKKADVDETGDAEVHAAKMKAVVRNRKMMMGGGADEFNLA